MPSKTAKPSNRAKRPAQPDAPRPTRSTRDKTGKTTAPTATAQTTPPPPAEGKRGAGTRRGIAPEKPLAERVRVSLIEGDAPDTPPPAQEADTPAASEESAPSQPAPKRVRKVLPPISRIRARQQENREPAAATPPEPGAGTEAAEKSTPAPEQPPAPPETGETAEKGAPEGEMPQVEEGEDETVLHLKSPITVKDLADLLHLKVYQVISDLIAMKIFPGGHGTLVELDTAQAVCAKHGVKVELVKRTKGGGAHKPEPVVAPPEPEPPKPQEALSTRAPIITFMGHVDHGKTSLMDAIRKTKVAAGEAGSITQHIGAYEVEWHGHTFTFLDTPGHEAFTAMRARGAQVTDIVVLVVAADDGVMPQTVEAIHHAKAAGVTILVAINKIDLPAANVERVLRQLQEQDLSTERYGGETVCCQVSATKGTGIDHLLDMLSLQSELLELKGDPSLNPRATVIESQFEPGRGPTGTVIVRVGTLRRGQVFLCGHHEGRIRTMLDHRGAQIKEAGPSKPVKLLGFSGLPSAGDELVVMESEKGARTVAAQRKSDARQKKLAPPQRATLENLLASTAPEGQVKILRVVLKTDVHGSLEATSQSMRDIRSAKVELNILHGAVGPISEHDVLLASASNAVVIGFNTRVEPAAAAAARREGVQIKLYSIIYELLDQVREAMTGLLEPELRESVIGRAAVRKVFELSRGKVAGCVVVDGRVSRTARARVLRDRQPIYDGGVATLRRFQADVREVRSGLECGIRLGDFDDYEPDDVIECYLLEKIPQKL